tara:strand:+ start:3375 stop:4406 length:1032 start_codon:yes stop_codon:yes gene_type:complete
MQPDNASASSVEAIFKPAFDEISRRQDVAKSRVWDETTYFAPSVASINIPFAPPDQQFALISMGTSVLAPRPVDPTRPSLRVYGAFATREEACEHSEIIKSMDASCSLMVVQLREWVLMPQDTTCLQSYENSKRCEILLQNYRVKQADDGDAFQKRIDIRDGGPVTTTQVEDAEDDADTKEAEDLVYKPPRKLRVGGEVRGQNYVAMCTVPNDITGECLVKILACFDTNQDADAWAQNVASRHVTDDDIHIGRTCEWVFPNGDPQSVSGPKYRIDELQRIMDTAERNPKAVQDYKTWKMEQDHRAEKNALKEGNGDGNDPAICDGSSSMHPSDCVDAAPMEVE